MGEKFLPANAHLAKAAISWGVLLACFAWYAVRMATSGQPGGNLSSSSRAAA